MLYINFFNKDFSRGEPLLQLFSIVAQDLAFRFLFFGGLMVSNYRAEHTIIAEVRTEMLAISIFALR